MTIRFRGEYRFTVLSANRVILRETDWMPNLITDIGLDRLGQGAWGAFCRIGTGTTAPANADTALVSQSASTNSVVSSSTANSGASNYETKHTVTYEFALGAVVGNMAEIGVGWASTGATLFSRARIVDGGGSPTTITVLVTEILQATYRLTAFPTLTDSTSTFLVSGVSTTYVSRWANAASVLSIQYNAPQLIPNTAVLTAYNGSLGAPTAAPSGSSAAMTNGTAPSYTPGTYYSDNIFNATLAQANLSGGISAALFAGGGANGQMSFSPAIAKDATKTLSLTVRTAWARRP